MGYLHFAMRIVRVPGVQAFRITIVSLLANNCLTHELMMHDTLLPLPFLIQAPPVILACRILELYNNSVASRRTEVFLPEHPRALIT